jgi:hypothetical protein
LYIGLRCGNAGVQIPLAHRISSMPAQSSKNTPLCGSAEGPAVLLRSSPSGDLLREELASTCGDFVRLSHKKHCRKHVEDKPLGALLSPSGGCHCFSSE